MIKIIPVVLMVAILVGSFLVLWFYRPVPQDTQPEVEEPFDITADIQRELDEEEARRLED